MRIYLVLFFLAWTLFRQPLSGQALQPDRYLMHLDKSFYVTGEVIWFKLLLPKVHEGKGFTIRVLLFNPKGEVADYFFIPTAGNTFASGYYKIPYDQPSGVYQLVFAAQDQASRQAVVLAQTAAPIYNDLEKPPAPDQVSNYSPASDSQKPADQGLTVEITLEKDHYRSREEVPAHIQVRNAAGQPVKASLSVSVTDWALAGSAVLPETTLTTGNTAFTGQLDSTIYLRMKQPDISREQQNLLGIFVPQEWQMNYATLNESQHFFISLPPFYGQKSIQVLSYPRIPTQFRIDEAISPGPALPLVYTPAILQYLELSRQRKKIYQLYGATESPLNMASIETIRRSIPPDRSFQVADYEPFENLAAFTREINTPLTFKLNRRDNRFEARVFNPDTYTYHPGDPLFVIDGKVTRNADFVARLSMSQVERIDIYNRFDRLKAIFGIIGSSGVVHLTTKSGGQIPPDEEADIFTINGLQIPAAFPGLKSDELEPHPNQPFFRPQVYWNPLVETDAAGKATIRFLQSDDQSRFRIQVVAQAEDGAVGYGSKDYRTQQ